MLESGCTLLYFRHMTWCDKLVSRTRELRSAHSAPSSLAHMVSTRASASVAVSAAPASAPTHTTLASRKRAAPAQRQANNKRRKLESESEADSSDSEASDYESGDKENLPEPATPRAARVLRRTSLAGVESPSSGASLRP